MFNDAGTETTTTSKAAAPSCSGIEIYCWVKCQPFLNRLVLKAPNPNPEDSQTPKFRKLLGKGLKLETRSLLNPKTLTLVAE